MREAVIVSTARTGIGKANRGFFNNTEATVLGAHVMNAAVERAGIDPVRINDVFYGAGNEWGTQGYNVARNTIFAAGLPTEVPAFTLDRKCGSGLTAIALAARGIMCDELDVALAGGMESITLTMKQAGKPYQNQSVIAKKPYAYMPMIETAEVVAERYGISRAAQDEFGAMSQQRAYEGLQKGAFAEEIVAITVEKANYDKEGNQTGTEQVTVTQDEGIRGGTTAEILSGLRTVFKDGMVIKEGKYITAGNASQLSDGAAAQINMVVKNKPGALATATAIFAKDGANIVNLALRHRDAAFHTYVVDLEVKNLQHLTRIMGALRATDVVSSVDRIDG